ncbi:D-alanyl-D-alanine carboxypeptidase/D-alanyl-D-alanine-endopeptidase [Mangrovibacterium sp.]|uniref:D-alanyl-D-alanine carboxypeptidase/D-alanyl-D-alanine endopeptidase n=1 Tax=Mangrovibacterium sp. TaxID=1961364 RepID=UPI00356ABA35
MTRICRQTLILCFLCLIFSTTEAQQPKTIQTFFDQWTRQENLTHASIGFYAQEVESGTVLASSSPQLSLVPASTMKLLTTSTALELLGANYRFETKLAYHGLLRNDTLFGDIVVIGGGDPALGSKYFRDHPDYVDFIQKWANAVRQLNIRHVTGNIIIDCSIYDDERIPNTWIWEDMGNYYGAGVFGLSAYDNTYEIHLLSPSEPNQATKLLYTIPHLPEIEFDNRVLSSNENRDKAYVFGSPLDTKRVIRGTIPKDRKDFKVKASIPNPPFLVGTQLLQELRLKGISLAGQIQCSGWENKDCLTPVSVIKSPTLATIISVTNYESVNLFAEHILKHIAYKATGYGTRENGIKLVRDFWETQGMNLESMFMEDGSGLSRFNALTAEQLVFVLNYMKTRSINSNAFFSSLPAVPDGTLWYFNHSLFPQKSLRAKSGSMTRVRCFAGQLRKSDGKEILFTVFLNNFSCSQGQAIKSIEQLLAAIRNQ